MGLIDFPWFRSLVWRLGRKLYCWGRREISRGPEHNGEYWLLRQVISSESEQPMIFIDIGVFLGSWTDYAASLLSEHGRAGHIHAFEPCASAYAQLAKKYRASSLISIDNIALSNYSGEREFYVLDNHAGTNSLIYSDDATVEMINSLRFDDFLEKAAIKHVRMVKCDAEGHDLSIMRGAEQALAMGKIDIWQFEYNHRWLGEKSSLRDVFEFIKNKPYVMGKLFNGGIEVFDQWHPELERYFEANYVLIHKGSGFESYCDFVQFNHQNILVQKA